MDSCDRSTSRSCLQGSPFLKPWTTASAEPSMERLNAVNAHDSNDGAALIKLFYFWMRRLIERLYAVIVNTNTGLACVWPVETECKLLVEGIEICLQFLLLWVIIRLCCKDFAITVYFLFVSFLIDAYTPVHIVAFSLHVIWVLVAIYQNLHIGQMYIILING